MQGKGRKEGAVRQVIASPKRIALGVTAAALVFGAFGAAGAAVAVSDDEGCPGGGKECAIKDHCVKWAPNGECIEAKVSYVYMKIGET